MKTKKKLVISCFFALLGLALSVGQSSAAVTCLNATIDEASITPWDSTWSSNYFIKATCNDATPAWSGSLIFYIRQDADLTESYYAAALTAVASGNNVELMLAGSTQYSLIHQIKILSTP